MKKQSDSLSFSFSNSASSGISYSASRLKLLRDTFNFETVRNIGCINQIIAEIRDISHGMIILELSYPYSIEIEENDRLMYIEQLFRNLLAPDFWDITYLHLVEYHTTGPGGYVGACGNIMYDQLPEDLAQGEKPSFNRRYFQDRLLNTGDLYHILYETNIRYFWC